MQTKLGPRKTDVLAPLPPPTAVSQLVRSHRLSVIGLVDYSAVGENWDFLISNVAYINAGHLHCVMESGFICGLRLVYIFFTTSNVNGTV